MNKPIRGIIKGLVISVLVGLFLLIAFKTLPQPPQMEKYDHKFEVGDFVKSKLNGQKGQVIRRYKYWDGLDVRFGAENSNDKIEIKVFSKVLMHEFELEEWSK